MTKSRNGNSDLNKLVRIIQLKVQMGISR